MSNYFTFWRITEPVFVRPGDGALFETPHVRELCAALKQFAETKQPLAVLSGAPGGGKTAMLRWLADILPMTTHDVFLTTLLSRETGSGWFLPRLAGYFRTKEKSLTDAQDAWKEAVVTGLQQLKDENRHLIIGIDAAHLICTGEAMSDMEAFFNLQDHAGHCISVILAGAPELVEEIQACPSLALRISTHVETKPLERPDLDTYVAWRLKKAGINATFEADALTMIYRQTGGNFLATGMALEKCLTQAAYQDSRRITSFVAEKALSPVAPKKNIEDLFSTASVELKVAGGPVAVAPAGEKQDNKEGAMRGAPTEQFPRKIVAEQATRGKNEADKPGSIKLSSLFKQDDD